MSFFESNNYRDAIRFHLQLNADTRGYQSKLAAAAGISPSSLSQVLKGAINLNSDQAYGLCLLWELDDLSTDFFLKLVEIERSSSPLLKTRLMTQIDDIRRQNERLHSRIGFNTDDCQTLAFKDAIRYWSQWYFSSIRELLFLEDFQSVEAIAARLSLSRELVEKVLQNLSEMQLAEFRDGSWYPAGKANVVQDDSTLLSPFQQSVRQRAVQRISEVRGPPDVFYTWVDTISKEDIGEVRKLIKDFVEKKGRIVRNPTKPKTDLMFFCMDMFML